MQSEVRRVLEREREQWDEYSFYKEIANAERSDAARRDESVQALRKEVAGLVDRWRTCFLPTPVAEIVRELLTELNAIIATKPESQPATASGPSVTFGALPKLTLQELIEKAAKEADQWRGIKPVIEPAVAEKIRAIAAQAVRDAMPDVLETVADAMKYDCGFDDTVDMIYMYAARLRKERGA